MTQAKSDRRALIVGATSGLGRALAMALHRDGYVVGAAGRRAELLETLRDELGERIHTARLDVTAPEASNRFDALVEAMGGVDLVVISAGVGFPNHALDVEPERATIETNVLGFTAIATAAMRRFEAAGAGHLVGISSVAQVRGAPEAPAYAASKAYVSNYLEGLRKRAARAGSAIHVTDVRPGFVDTAMAKGDGKGGGLFWVQSPEKAARRLARAIAKRRRRVYLSIRWRLLSALLRVLPDAFFHRI